MYTGTNTSSYFVQVASMHAADSASITRLHARATIHSVCSACSTCSHSVVKNNIPSFLSKWLLCMRLTQPAKKKNENVCAGQTPWAFRPMLRPSQHHKVIFTGDECQGINKLRKGQQHLFIHQWAIWSVSAPIHAWCKKQCCFLHGQPMSDPGFWRGQQDGGVLCPLIPAHAGQVKTARKTFQPAWPPQPAAAIFRCRQG